jgi:hypothetical protein
MLGTAYDKLAAALWVYLEEELPAENEDRDRIHADVLFRLDEDLRAAGVEVQ